MFYTYPYPSMLNTYIYRLCVWSQRKPLGRQHFALYLTAASQRVTSGDIFYRFMLGKTKMLHPKIVCSKNHRWCYLMAILIIWRLSLKNTHHVAKTCVLNNRYPVLIKGTLSLIIKEQFTFKCARVSIACCL